MTIYQILCLIGVPSIVATLTITITKKVVKKTADNKHNKELRMQALERGVQALLRGQMIADYNKWKEKGYAPIYAKDSFENCWQQYHNLGVNGVMDDIHNKFMNLPEK